MKNKNSTVAIVFIYCIILMTSLVIAFYSGKRPTEDEYLVSIQGDEFSPSFNSELILSNEDQRSSHEVSVEIQTEDKIGVLISRLASNGYEVYWNDYYIGQEGIEKANIWNGTRFIPIPDELVKEHNTLRIENFAYYKSGITSHPIYILELERGYFYQTWLQFFNSDIVYIGLGVLLISFSLLIILIFIFNTSTRNYIFLAFAMVFMGIYALDYTSISFLPLDYFTYKRIVMISFWTISMLYGISIYKILGNKLPLYTGILSWIGIVGIAVFSKDIIAFKTGYGIWYMTQLLNIFTWVISAWISYKKKVESRVFFVGFVTLLLFSGINLYLDNKGIFFSMNSPIIYISIFSIIPLMLIYFYIKESRSRLEREMELRKRADLKANHDALTGVFNKHYLTEVIENILPPYSFAMFDFDDYKRINDNYGHRVGNELMKYIVDNMLGFLREEDILCRIGGDEFVVVLPAECDIAKKRMLEFTSFLADNPFVHGNEKIDMTISVGIFFVEEMLSENEILHLADTALYESKRNGKNKISIYNKK